MRMLIFLELILTRDSCYAEMSGRTSLMYFGWRHLHQGEHLPGKKPLHRELLLDLCSRESYMRSPPSPPPILAGRHFSGRGGGGYILKPPTAGILYAQPCLIRPPPLQGYFQGWGCVYKNLAPHASPCTKKLHTRRDWRMTWRPKLLIGSLRLFFTEWMID